MSNKYLEQIEKQASLTGMAALHVLQNAGTNVALRSKRFARGLSKTMNRAANGAQKTIGDAAKNFGSGALLPDLVIMHNKAHEIGQAISEHAPHMTKRDWVGVRMMTQGRFNDLVRHGLHKSPGVQRVAQSIQEKSGIPVHHLLQLADHPASKNVYKHVGQTWTDKNLPLLSNVMSNATHHIGEATKTVSETGKKISHAIGKHVQTAMGAGAAAMGSHDIGTGLFNSFKQVIAHPGLQENKYIQKANKFIFTDPAKEGFKKGLNGSKLGRAQVMFKKHIVNPLAGHGKETANRIGEAIKKGLDEYN